MAAHSSPRHHHKNTSSYHLGNFGHLANLLELKREHLAREAQINFQKLLLKVQDQIQSQGGAGMPTRELMLISVPGDPTPEQSLDKVQRKIKGLADIYNFSIPKFKVGTLDQLVSLSETLAKMESDAEQITSKISSSLAEVRKMERTKLLAELKADHRSPIAYVTMFEWDKSRFPLNLPAKHLSEMISKQYDRIHQEMDRRMAEYRLAKKKVDQNTSDHNQNLARRSLTRIVPRDKIVESDYLMTAFVVVPKTRTREWANSYETFGTYVVPRSSEIIFADEDQTLFGVTIFKKFEEEFKREVTMKQYVYRTFEYIGEEEAIRKQEETANNSRTLREKEGPLCLWLKINFGEAFICYIHLKVIRLFVESVLRYGLPINFGGALIEPHKTTAASRKAILHGVDDIFAEAQDSIARQKLTAKDMAEYPHLKEMVVTDQSLEYSFIVFTFGVEVPAAEERNRQQELRTPTAAEVMKKAATPFFKKKPINFPKPSFAKPHFPPRGPFRRARKDESQQDTTEEK